MLPANKRMRERSRQPIPPPLSPSISLSGAHHFLFFHLHLSVMRLLIPPALVLAHVYLRRSHFFFIFFLSHSFTLSFLLSCHRGCLGPLCSFIAEGVMVQMSRQRARLSCPPSVSSTIRVFDQFVTGAGDCASALQHCRQQEH